MTTLTLDGFKKKFSDFSAKCEFEGIEFEEIKISGTYESTIIGFKNLNEFPWETNDEIKALMENDPVLKHAMINRPLFKMKDPKGRDVLSTFDVGQLSSSVNLRHTALTGINTDIKSNTWSLDLSASMLSSLNKACKNVDWAAVRKGGFTNSIDGPYDVDNLTSRNDMFDLTGIEAVEQWVNDNGRLFGVNERHSRVIKGEDGEEITVPGKIWLGKQDAFGISWTSSNEKWWQGATPMNKLANVRVSPLERAIAPDCRHASVSFYIGGKGSTGPDSTPMLENMYELASGNVFKDIPMMSSVWYIQLVVEIPLHSGPSDTAVEVSRDFFASQVQKPNVRYGNMVDTSANYLPLLAVHLYGDLEVKIRNSWRKISAMPVKDHNVSAPASFDKIHPIIGVPPKLHSCFVGSKLDGVFNSDVHMFKMDRDWLREYQIGAFGRKLKVLNADKLAQEWPENVPDQFCVTNYRHGFDLTREMIESTNVARRYKKARESACKTDNFMQLTYADGVTYKTIVDNIQRQGGITSFGVYSAASLVNAGDTIVQGVIVDVKKSTDGNSYEMTTDGKTYTSSLFKTASATEESKAKCLEWVGCAIGTGGIWPSTWTTDLAVPADVSSAILSEGSSEAFGGGRGLQVVVTPSNLGGTTGMYHSATSLSRNGFFVPDLMAEEQRIESILHSSVVTIKSINSANRIFKQFCNSAYSSLV